MSSELLQEVPKSIEHVKHIILILSGKGGVGKSSVTTQVALTLVNKGFNVGVLDIDLTGPSLPRMFGVENKQVHQSTQGWVPVSVYNNNNNQGTDSKRGNLSLMSLGFCWAIEVIQLYGEVLKTAMIKQFLKDVVWGSTETPWIIY